MVSRARKLNIINVIFMHSCKEPELPKLNPKQIMIHSNNINQTHFCRIILMWIDPNNSIVTALFTLSFQKS